MKQKVVYIGKVQLCGSLDLDHTLRIISLIDVCFVQNRK